VTLNWQLIESVRSRILCEPQSLQGGKVLWEGQRLAVKNGRNAWEEKMEDYHRLAGHPRDENAGPAWRFAHTVRKCAGVNIAGAELTAK